MSSRTVTTLAGVPGSAGAMDGVGSAAMFNNPIGVAMDAAGGVAIVVSEIKGSWRKIGRRLQLWHRSIQIDRSSVRSETTGNLKPTAFHNAII
jgi:hypothetical protein